MAAQIFFPLLPTPPQDDPGSLMVHPLSMRSTLLPLPIFLLDPSKTILFKSDHLKLDSLPELFSLIFIDREAREIILSVASVRPSVCVFVYALNHHDTWNTVQDLCVFVNNQETFAIKSCAAVGGF